MGQEEILKQSSELEVRFEHEKGVRDREKSTLKMFIAILKQEASMEREERIIAMASRVQTVQSLEVRMTERLESEIAERSSVGVHMEKQYVNINIASEADCAAVEALARTPDSGLRDQKQIQETEKKQ